VEPEEIAYFPGQYMDFQVPGTDATRSFSMAATPSREGVFEFVIRCYPGGLFSGLLAEGIGPGDRLAVEGPFGAFRLRDSLARLVFVGGGAGIAPLLALLRSMAERGIDRPVTFYYGARTRRDLPFEEELTKLCEQLPGFVFVPALSEPSADDAWNGETGLITDVVTRRESDLSGVDAYVCGPPPMVEAAIATLERLGRTQDHIYYDKFTTTGEPEGEK
jgi:propane monooxygenase reductase subunit